MPATNLPVAKVTKEKNKLVITQHNKKNWYNENILFWPLNIVLVLIIYLLLKLVFQFFILDVYYCNSLFF